MKKVLLHICCGVCAYSSIERLKEENFYVEALFFNPNIQPYSEYLKRKETAKKVVRITNIELIEGKYTVFDWFRLCKAYSQEQEGGRRCFLCYELRLKQTFDLCCQRNFDYFTTTLTISPHKKSSVIMEIGKNIGKDKFLPLDFKKNNGFKRTMEAAKRFNLYRQNYCGCIYSRKKKLV